MSPPHEYPVFIGGYVGEPFNINTFNFSSTGEWKCEYCGRKNETGKVQCYWCGAGKQ